MPKRWPFSIARLFPTPPKPHFTKWPRKWPSHQPIMRISPRRSELRFTPMAAGKIEYWIVKRLIIMQRLLEQGENESALAFCDEELSEPALFPRPGRYDFMHRAISLFTRHGDFTAATSLYNRIVDEGYAVSKKTDMVMLRGARSHTAKQIEEFMDMMLRGTGQLDDLAFKSMLDLMILHRRPPDDLEAALKVYSASRGEDWVMPISMFGTIIQSYSLAGRLDEAEKWLDKYRKVWVTDPKLPRPTMGSPPEPATQVVTTKVPVEVEPTEAEVPVEAQPTKVPAEAQPTKIPVNPRFKAKIRRQSGILLSKEDPHYPYTAILIGYAKSSTLVQKRIRWLFRRMRSDGVTPDIPMYNILIPALVSWGWTHRAFTMFRSLLHPDTNSLPDAYTFRHLFVAMNPKRPRSPYERAPPNDLSTRDLFNDMLKVARLRLHSRKPQPHKNLISTATFNCALGTFIAQGDYAAAWTVLALFTRYHIRPDAKTSHIVVLSLLRRMRTEAERQGTMGEVMWVDRFMGQHRSTILESPHKMMFTDRLYLIGRSAVAEMNEEGYQTYLKPSSVMRGSTKNELEFLVAFMRTALQASLGFTRATTQTISAGKAISAAMIDARNAMIPRGRSERN